LIEQAALQVYLVANNRSKEQAMHWKPLPVMLAAFAVTCHAADGDMDAGFGTNGSIVLAPPDSSPQALTVAIQDDGKIVVGGSRWAFGQDLTLNQAAVWRFLPDGTADPTFGDGGLSAIAIGQSVPFVFSVLPLPSGDILVAGNLGGFAVMRLHGDGALDAEFGNGGIATVDFSDLEFSGMAAIGVTADSQGRILLAGGGKPPNSTQSGPYFGAVARLLPSGIPDPDFGASGRVVIPVGNTTSGSRVLFRGVQRDGGDRIWLSGLTNATQVSGVNSFLAARLDEFGNLDGNFGNGGIVTSNLSQDSDDWGNNGVLDHGRWTIGGSCDPGGMAALCFLRLDEAGTPDAGFGTDGWAVAMLGSGSLRPGSLACQSDGKCLDLVAAPSPTTSLRQFVVARVDGNGILDSGFGTNGIARIDVPISGDGGHVIARGMAIQSGRPILVGSTDGVPDVNALYATRLDDELIFSGHFD